MDLAFLEWGDVGYFGHSRYLMRPRFYGVKVGYDASLDRKPVRLGSCLGYQGRWKYFGNFRYKSETCF